MTGLFKKMDAAVQRTTRALVLSILGVVALPLLAAPVAPAAPSVLSGSAPRLGTVSGVFRSLDPQRPLPSEVTLRALEPLIPHSGRPVKRRLFRCPLDERGAWSCELPVATYDLAVGAEGFVPQRRPGVRVLFHRNFELGKLDLEPSQSITGWLTVEEGRFDPQECLLQVAQGEGTERPEDEVYQGDPLLIERIVRSDGSFRITDVNPGRYNVGARLAGYAMALRTNVEVVRGKTTALVEPLVLRRTFDIEVGIEPPLDGHGNAWELAAGKVLEGPNGAIRTIPAVVAAIAPAGSGRYLLSDQVGGRFWYAVTDSDGSIFVSGNDLRVEDRSQARVVLRAPSLEVEGTITRGGEPMQVDFMLLAAEGGADINLTADRQGHFHGRAPHTGLWRACLYAMEDGQQCQTVALEEDRPGHSTVDLRLPDVRLFGRVEDEQGGPAQAARVHYLAQGQSGEINVDEDGRFEVKSLPAGPIVLRAVRPAFGGVGGLPGAFGEAQEVELRDGRESGPIVLRLSPPQAWSGVLLESSGKPADGWLEAALPDGIKISLDQLDLSSGEFGLTIPAKAKELTLFLVPNDGAFRARTVAVEAVAPTLRLDEGKGTVHLDLEQPWGRVQALGKTLEIEQDGVRIPLGRLVDWASDHGAGVRLDHPYLDLPDLAPGHYRLCLGSEGPRDQIDPAARKSGDLDCVSGSLVAGGELRLSLP